mgnify:CR=1 FL=1|jgi:hypothetical protein
MGPTMWFNLVRRGSLQDIEDNEDYYEALTEEEFEELVMSDEEFEVMGKVHVPLLYNPAIRATVSEYFAYKDGFPRV